MCFGDYPANRLVHRLDLFDLRRVPAGAVQLLAAMPCGGGGKDFLGFPIPSAAGLVASLTLLIIHFNENEKNLGHWNYLLAGGARVFVGDDGQHRALSELQIARAALEQHFHQGHRCGVVPRLPVGAAGKNPLLCAAGVFHAVSALWFRAAKPLPRLAPGN